MASVVVRVRRIPVGGGVPRIIAAVNKNSATLAYHYAQRVEGGAKRRVHVITGNLKRSIQRYRMARGKHRVIVGMYYGVYEEYGTRYRPPHPYFRPAVRDARVAYNIEKRKVFRP